MWLSSSTGAESVTSLRMRFIDSETISWCERPCLNLEVCHTQPQSPPPPPNITPSILRRLENWTPYRPALPTLPPYSLTTPKCYHSRYPSRYYRSQPLVGRLIAIRPTLVFAKIKSVTEIKPQGRTPQLLEVLFFPSPVAQEQFVRR